ncbi:MAG: hypothetical protein Q7W38_14675 [Deltaproteobacteria bacterium]|nr:hypothetical protein [Deltaproteobacteria bacterium]
METSPRPLSINQEEMIKGKLREKLLEIRIELGFVSRAYPDPKFPVPEYKVEASLWEPEVVKKEVDKFNELKSNVKAWLPLGNIDEDAVKKVIEEFIKSEIETK